VLSLTAGAKPAPLTDPHQFRYRPHLHQRHQGALCASRPALARLLDPDNDAVTLNTLQKAAKAVGRELRLELV
jgi:hypothetical protein